MPAVGGSSSSLALTELMNLNVFVLKAKKRKDEGADGGKKG